MLALLLGLTALAGDPEAFVCGQSNFELAAATAALAAGPSDADQRLALENAHQRLTRPAMACPEWAVPGRCATPLAEPALAEASARMVRIGAARALADGRSLPSLVAEVEQKWAFIARIDAAIAEADRNPVDVDDLTARRAETEAEVDALLAAVAGVHTADTAFHAADQEWIAAAIRLNRERCPVASCSAEAGQRTDPACPGEAHAATAKVVDKVRALHGRTGAALASFSQDYGLDAMRARVRAAGAEGMRPAVLEVRAAAAWQLVVESAARPAAEHQRIGTVLARVDGVQRASPATDRWLRAALVWGASWERSLSRLDADLDELTAAWAEVDRTAGVRGRVGARDRVNRAINQFRAHAATGLPPPPQAL
jgi:hypothetical protein